MDKTVSILLSYEPFMACLVQRCKLRWTDKCPTAGVRILPGGVIELLVNPEFFYLQSEAARVGLIWHEMYHLICGHIDRSYGLDPQVANIAMDEAINQLIPQKFLPKKAILPEYFNHEKRQAFEVYYNLHKSRNDNAKYQQKKEYKGGINDEDDKKEIMEQIKKKLEEMVANANSQVDLKNVLANTSGSDNSELDSLTKNVKVQDEAEDFQEELTERMEALRLKPLADLSEDVSDLLKTIRKDLESKLDQMTKTGADAKLGTFNSQNTEIQAKQTGLQKDIDDLLKKLEEIQKQEQQRQQQQQNQQQQGQGQSQQQQGGGQGQDGEQQDGDGQGQGNGQGQGQGQSGLGKGNGKGQGKPQQGGGSGLGQGQGQDETPEVMDSHDMWHTSPASQDQQKASLSSILNQAIADAERQFGYGSIPTALRQMLDNAMKKPKVKWSTIIKNYWGRCLSVHPQYTRKKPSRKLGFLSPGKNQKLGPKILIMVDCSGSVGNDEYIELMTESKGIAGELIDCVTVGYFDTQVFEKTYKLEAHSKKFPSRPMSGGTDFQCVIDFANKMRPDLLIILTDGCAPVPKRPKFPVIWAIVGGRDNPALFGKRVLVELENNKGQNSKVLGND